MCTWHHLKGCKKHYMPRIAEESKGKLSETKITYFSSMIAQRILKNFSEERADKNIEEYQMRSLLC